MIGDISNRVALRVRCVELGIETASKLNNISILEAAKRFENYISEGIELDDSTRDWNLIILELLKNLNQTKQSQESLEEIKKATLEL